MSGRNRRAPGAPSTSRTLRVLKIVAVIGMIAGAPAKNPAAQSRPKQSTQPPTTGTRGSAVVPRTPEGRPDLEGAWDYRTITPLERPPQFAGKTVLTDAEAKELERLKATFDAAA